MNNMLNSMKKYEEELKKESAEYLTIENAKLEDKIEELQQENKQLKEELNKYKNIIEELKKYAKEDKKDFEISVEMGRCVNYNDLINKIEELENGDSNE